MGAKDGLWQDWNGKYCFIARTGGEEAMFYRLCDFFTVIGSTEDPSTGEALLVIRFIDAYRKVRELSIPRGIIAQGDRTLAAFCASNGFTVSTTKQGRAKVQELLTSLHGPRVISPDRAGWVGSTNAFVLPTGRLIGDIGTQRITFDKHRAREAHTHEAGSYEQWKRVTGKLVPGNSRLVLAMAMSFASPLMRFAPTIQSTILNCWGETSRGKSIAGFLFGSTWGGDPERRLNFAHPWNQTANSVMAVASSHSDIGMVFDELGTAKTPGETAYDFSQGEERGRLNSDSSMKRRRKWRAFAWSSGERTLYEAMLDTGKKFSVSSGTEVRLIDLQVETGGSSGIVEQLNGMPNSRAFVEALEDLAKAHYGHAGPAFVEKLQAQITRSETAERELKDRLSDMSVSFIARLNLPSNADSVVVRAAKVFALWCSAGELASELGIIDVAARDMRDGVERCFKDWLATRGSITKTAAQREGLTALHDFMTANVGKFVPISGRLGVVLGDVSEHALGVAGAIGYRGEYADRKVYFMTTKAWKEVQDKARRGNIAKQLDDAGLLVRGKSDGNKRMTVRVYVPTSATTNERLYLYAVDQKFMQLGEDGTLNDDNEHIQQSDGSWADRWGNTTQPALNLATEVNAMPEQAKPVKKQRRVAPVPAVVLGEAEKRSLTRH